MEISLATFKKLLHSLKDQEIGLKVKTHNGWSNDYLQIIGFISSISEQETKTFGGVVLSNSTETEGVLINNISTITAFELEHRHQEYEAGQIYVLGDVALNALIIQ
jgi:hypothetical protein